MDQNIQHQVKSHLTPGFISQIVSDSNVCTIDLNLIHILRIMERKRSLQLRQELSKKFIQKLFDCAVLCKEAGGRCLNDGQEEKVKYISFMKTVRLLGTRPSNS